jgi:uncharacterized protein (TIGR03067 family)
MGENYSIEIGEKELGSVEFEFSADGKGWLRLDDKEAHSSERHAFTYTLDAGKNPKWIILQFDDEKKATHGLYSLEGDTLRIAAWGGPDAKRPDSFSQNDVQVTVLRRTGP